MLLDWTQILVKTFFKRRNNIYCPPKCPKFGKFRPGLKPWLVNPFSMQSPRHVRVVALHCRSEIRGKCLIVTGEIHEKTMYWLMVIEEMLLYIPEKRDMMFYKHVNFRIKLRSKDKSSKP